MQGCGPKDHREGPSTVCALLVFFRAGKKKKKQKMCQKIRESNPEDENRKLT